MPLIRTEENMKWLKAMMTAGYQFYPKQGVGKDKIWYGDIIYDDLDGDGVYGDDDDRAFQGYSRTPKYYFGLQMNAAWKGFDWRTWSKCVSRMVNASFVSSSAVNGLCAMRMAAYSSRL